MTAKKLHMYPVNDAASFVGEPISKGFYLKARKIEESEIAHTPPHIREIWDWLIKSANFADKMVYGRLIKRGQLFTSYKEIQDGLHWMVGYRKETYSKSQCETAMKWLVKHDMITTLKTTRGLIITVCKYDTYQSIENYDTYTENRKRTTRKPQSSDTIHKEGKEYKESKELNGSTAPQKWLYSREGFFDRQLASNEGAEHIEEYRELVEFLHGKNKNSLVFENVLKLEKQISYKDFVTLKERAKSSTRTIGQVLADMENTAGLTKKYKNAYLTVNKWLQNDFKK